MIHVDVKVDLSGFDRLEAKLGEAADEAALAMATAGHDDSQVLVPVDTGALRRSGVVDVQKKGSAEAVVQYGGKSMPHDVAYAGYVHEGHRSKSGFLRTPFMNRRKMRDAAAGVYRRILGKSARGGL